jgi:hypothetical protein
VRPAAPARPENPPVRLAPQVHPSRRRLERANPRRSDGRSRPRQPTQGSPATGRGRAPARRGPREARAKRPTPSGPGSPPAGAPASDPRVRQVPGAARGRRAIGLAGKPATVPRPQLRAKPAPPVARHPEQAHPAVGPAAAR